MSLFSLSRFSFSSMSRLINSVRVSPTAFASDLYAKCSDCTYLKILVPGDPGESSWGVCAAAWFSLSPSPKVELSMPWMSCWELVVLRRAGFGLTGV